MIPQLPMSNRVSSNHESGTRQRGCSICNTKGKCETTIKICVECQVNLVLEIFWIWLQKNL